MRTEAELRLMLTELADTAPDPATASSEMQLRGTGTSPAQAGPAGPRRRPARLALALCVCAVLALVAVLVPALSPRIEPAGPRLEPRYEGTMTVAPSAARPSEWVELNFPDGGHGTNFTLDTWNGSGWDLSYYLVAYSMSGHGRVKPWWRVGDPGGVMPEPFGMPTERVIVPPVATAGVYRLCQLGGDKPAAAGSSAPPTHKACGLLTVT